VSGALEVSDLRAGYGKAEVLHGLSIQAAQGTVSTVIGANGAGKSTLLKALMGLIPSTGTIRFDGRDIGRTSLEARVLAGIALVPETRELFSTMSVEDNLVLGGWAPRQLGVKNWRDGVERNYALFPRLKERRLQLAGTLSGGERQMLALARALMGQPRLLLLDEPSLGLAPLVVREIFRTIEQLRSTGVTVVLVEQNARAALRVADHAYVLETGTVAADAPASVLAGDPRVTATYLGVGVA
jgi:branched-chain amino acid transport system ATP-binding protein